MVVGSLVYVMNEGVMDKIKGGWKALKHKGHEDDTFGDDVIRRGATKIGDKLHLGGKGKTALGVAGHVGSIYAKGKAGATIGTFPGALAGATAGGLAAGPVGAVAGGLYGGTLGYLGGAAAGAARPAYKFLKKSAKSVKQGSGKGIFYNDSKPDKKLK